MQRLTKHYSLFDLEPNLKKEWHPSLNGKLTPQNVTVALSKKIWWLCNEGHEWKSSVKYRIKGKGCPFCADNLERINSHRTESSLLPNKTDEPDRDDSRKKNIILESDSTNFYLGENYRSAKRFKVNATAVIEIPASGHWFYTTIRDISNEGLCFETEGFLKKGALIKVKLDQPLITPDRKNYRSIIRWCNKLEDENPSISTYGIGVQFV